MIIAFMELALTQVLGELTGGKLVNVGQSVAALDCPVILPDGENHSTLRQQYRFFGKGIFR